MAMATTSSIGLLQSLAKPKPNKNPIQGSPMPHKNTCHVIILNINKLAQTPKMRMNKIKNNANGFKIFAKKADTLGANLDMINPIDNGTTKKNA